MQHPGYTLQVSLDSVGDILRIGEEYRLPDLYLGILPTSEELHVRDAEGLGGITLTIESDHYNDLCYCSLTLPQRDPTRRPATVSAWGWETLVHFSLPVPAAAALMETLSAVQRLRRVPWRE